MNKYTNLSNFIESASYILENSELLIKENCVILDDILYERLNNNHYRFFFSVDDYDYLENEQYILRLNSMF